MRSNMRRVLIGSAVTLMTAGVIAAPPATAQNYAPGLPPAAPGVPNNPPTRAEIVPGIVLVPERVAENTTPRQVNRAPGALIGEAPRIPARVRQPIAFVVPNSPPGTTWVIEMKRVGGTYNTLGSTVVTPGGDAVLPVFRPTERGIFVIVLRNVQTGQVVYLKAEVRR
jgi:hypothetical protein